MSLEFATLAGGCFWCTEAVYNDVIGVESVESGYIGGHVANPTYKQVCGGDSGHAEAIRVGFDPERISYAELLDIFFATHDPTTLNRQGNDEGTQYRSVIFYHDEKQKLVAEKSKLAAQNDFSSPIVTAIVPFTKFYPAEDYHQGYYDDNTNAAYCRVVITPKLEKLEHKKVIEPTVQTPK